VFVLDTKKEHIAVTEANKLGILVVAVVDTNQTPTRAVASGPRRHSCRRFHAAISDAVGEGRFIASPPAAAPPPSRTAEQAALAEAQADARRQAAAGRVTHACFAADGRPGRGRRCRRGPAPETVAAAEPVAAAATTEVTQITEEP
jgi:small subunit ribosomal protein S2